MSVVELLGLVSIMVRNLFGMILSLDVVLHSCGLWFGLLDVGCYGAGEDSNVEAPFVDISLETYPRVKLKNARSG